MSDASKPFGGFTGRILRVDLSTSRVEVEEPDKLIYRRYGGCGGLAVYYLLRELPVGVNPLGPDNLMVFMTSAMNGTPMWGCRKLW